MKTLKYLFQSLFIIFFAACSMEPEETIVEEEVIETVSVEVSEVPESIKQAFIAQNPEVTDAVWVMEGDVYEAEYSVDGMERSMVYNQAGRVIESEVQILPEELPEVVRDYIAANFGEYSIGDTEVEIVEGVVFYEVEISANGDEKELLFDTSGNLVEDENEDKDDDNGDDD